MKFFDSLMDEADALLAPYRQRTYPLGKKWRDLGRNTLVLKRDEAFELTGVGFNLVTARPIEPSGITVVGPELSALNGDTPFARISLIQTEAVEDEQMAFDTVRKVEYQKYHYFPEGFMVRTVSSSHKENVRVTKKALQAGISFEAVGNLLAEKYLELPAVKSARIIYVTDSAVDFAALEALAEKNDRITETLNHIMQNIPLDCSACRLKPVCDEVEGMRELHFKTAGQGM
ncbi:MAG: hypothetical protein IJ168_04300 [Eubacterium sp.]|nr:hypothetical protein [Eubacterium sp.]